MSGKKSKASTQPQDAGANKPPKLKKDLRKDMREMYQATQRIDKDELISKYLALYPGKKDYINIVVNGYTTSLETRKGPSQQPSIGVSLPAKNGSPTPPVKEHPEEKQPRPVTQQQKPSSWQPEPAVEPFKPRIDLEQTKPNNAVLQEFKEHLDLNQNGRHIKFPIRGGPSTVPPLENQMQFMSLTAPDDNSANSSSNVPEEAVLLSPSVERVGHSMPSQFALLGQLRTPQSGVSDPRVMLNTNIPFSAFICGLQGSGKSHTTSCIIENCSMTFPALGTLKKPLSTLVLHYNEYSSNLSSQPSETVFLSSVMTQYRLKYKPIPVRVLVSPSNFYNLQRMYSQIPNVEVRPFRLQPHHLSISMMLSLMSLGKNDSMPLYMGQLTKILREMAMENEGAFNYSDFRTRLNGLRLDRAQTPFLEQRLGLLDSFLDLHGQTSEDYFIEDGVTILDLSCPFMDQSTTCILFRIAINLFLHGHPSRGKMIVADEAHKYMTDTPAAKELTEAFLNIIRQQRHLGVRTIISTQEPTISPRLIDLCSITIIHRFSSPEWYKTIKKHVTIEDTQGVSDEREGLYQISSLRTGEALVFAPSAYLLYDNQSMINTRHATFKMMMRKRVTWDGGRTIACIR
ncbi:hypothetical protein EYZ11_004337 [Aspergillus tanneri]|uniref:Zona occludens toxin N-terminal domain-containing protein n=1 Tax=Aspergillus tanneri TaxID=1220188 RepID=A0A4V3UPS1_9EURO|nr:uncharacterized protein ATNIH1004_009563 [Aspergillus tanneri]KAA8642811.1 hypothetical protein ATNIH1004_009563 [Aspergillus tanneri]THC96174.1 hypothetical protein EYZ11_004337 [Aspergillus tanneri]